MMSAVGQFLQHERGQRTKHIYRNESQKQKLERKATLRESHSQWDLKHIWDDMHYRSVVRKVRGPWQQMVDVYDKTAVYYYNTLTDESQWEPPDEFVEYDDVD